MRRYRKMQQKIKIGISVIAILACAACIAPRDIRAQTATTTPGTAATLQAQIQEKNQELITINQELQAANTSLNTTKNQRITLQSQIQGIDNNVNTLTLGIKADTVTTQQLQLEIQQLSSDQQDITASIALKTSAIQTILQEIEKNDSTNGNLLALFLKSGTLADGVLEANTLIDLQAQLSSDIGALRDLHTEYGAKIDQGNTKQQAIATQQADLQNKVAIVQDQKTEKQALLASTKDQESAFQKQLSALQKQQQSINDQIEAIDAILRTKIDPSTIPALGAGVLAIPVQGDTQASITQGYGVCTDGICPPLA